MRPRDVADRITKARLAGETWKAILSRERRGYSTVAWPEAFLWRALEASTRPYLAALKRDPCGYCGARGGERDHIIPRVVVGGETATGIRATAVANLTGACGRCNREKRSESLLGFLLGRGVGNV